MNSSKSTTTVTVRRIPRAVHRALPVRAARHGHSVEAEIRAILEAAVMHEGRIKMGSILAGIGREAGGFDVAIERDRVSSEPTSFE